MKSLIVGSNGQLGVALAETAPVGAVVTRLGHSELDISDAGAVFRCCREVRPDVVINAAAYTAVDPAESDEFRATAVNVDGARNLAIAAEDVGSRLIHISTDYVFGGDRSTPYPTDAATRPLNVYGRTKRDGELVVLEATSGAATVIRTSWLYSKTGHNFVKSMLRLMQQKDEIGVVFDQVGKPTWSESLARATWATTERPGISGIVHWADDGITSWYGFAVEIQQQAIQLGLLRRKIPIRPLTTAEYPTAAIRPNYSALDCSTSQQSLGLRPGRWQSNLGRMLEGLA